MASAELVRAMKEVTEFQQQLRNNINAAESMVMTLERIMKPQRTLETKLEQWSLELEELECLTKAYCTTAADGVNLLSPIFEFLKTDATATSSQSDSYSSSPCKVLRSEATVSSKANSAINDSASVPVSITKPIMNPVEIMSSVNTTRDAENGRCSAFENLDMGSGETTHITKRHAQQHSLNPLEIPLILENIFSFLRPRDLSTCRQVSSLWEAYSQKYWRALAHVQIICGPGRIGRQMRSGGSATEFVEFVQERGMFHRRSLYANFTVSISRNDKLFWNLCGPWIKTLRLRNCRFPTSDDFRKVVYQGCPNMQELQVERLHFPWDFASRREPTVWTPPQHGANTALKLLTAPVDPRELPVSWMELISHFPELKVLNLKGVLTSAVGHGKEVSSTLAIILQQNPTPLKLRHTSGVPYHYFQESDVIPTEFITAVEHPKLHLESVCVWMNEPDASAILRRILVANSATLKKLRLYRNYSGTRLELSDSFRLPGDGAQLMNLQEIEIVCDNFESLSFLRFAPHLTKLTLSRRWGWSNGNRTMGIIERTNMLEMAGVVLTNCAELKIGFELLSQEIQKLCSLLPNVTKLWTNEVHEDELALVRDYWPNADLKMKDHSTGKYNSISLTAFLD